MFQTVLVRFTLLFLFFASLAFAPAARATLRVSNVITGNWNATATWSGGVVPASSDTAEIVNGATVTVSSSATCAGVKVDSGGDLVTSAVLTINHGATTYDFDVYGQLDCQTSKGITFGTANGTPSACIESGGTFLGDSASSTVIQGTVSPFYIYGTFNVVANRVNMGIPSATWEPGSLLEYTGVTSDTGSACSIPAGAYNNITWNCTGQTSKANPALFANSPITINGTFNIANTGSGQAEIANSSMTLNIGGNITVGSGATVGVSSTGGSSSPVTINFTGTGTITMSGTWYEGGASSGGGEPASWNINNGSVMTLGANWSMAGPPSGNYNFADSLTVAGGGTLNCSTYNILNNSASGSQANTFTLSSGGTLEIGSLDSTGGITTSGAHGNIQVSGTRSYSTGANYTYNGASAQVAGNGLPSAVNGLTIANNSGAVSLSGAVTATNLTINSGATLDVSSSDYGITVVGSWTDNGTFKPETGTVTFVPGASTTLTVAGSTTFTNVAVNTGAKLALAANQTTANLSLSSTNKAAGTWGATGSGATFVDNNYFSGALGTMNVTVGVPQTIAFGLGSSYAANYGAQFADTATASSGLAVTYSSDNTGVATVNSGGTVTIVGVGTSHILANQSGSVNYNPATLTSQSLTANQLPVVLSGTRSYDKTTNAAAVILSVANKVGSDNVTVTSGVGGLAGVNVGTQNITYFDSLTLGGAQVANYTMTGGSGTVIVSATNLTVTAQANTKLYDGTTNATATPTVTVGSVQSGDTANFTESYASKNVGSSKTLTPTGAVSDGNGGNNYSYTYTPANIGVINATNLTVTAQANSKLYDGTTNAAATPTITAGGVQTGDTANFTESFADPNAGNNKTLTPAGIVNDSNSGNNYNYTFVHENTGTILAVGTTVAVNSSENPSGYKDTVIFTAVVQTNGVTLGNATGNVLFLTNGVLADTEGLVSGVATATNSASSQLPRGTNTITAQYAGDSNYIGSTNNLSDGQVVTNHPPAAAVMTVYRTADLNLMVALSDIATNWSDTDGDNVELTGVNLLSTNSQTLYLLNVTTNGDGSLATTNFSFVGYTNNSNINDQFSYSIVDSYGGTNIGYVNIVIVSSVGGTNSITAIASGNPTIITAYGIPGYTYVAQRATNLVSPVWINIATNFAATNGMISASDSFTDLGGTPPLSAYYRLSWSSQ
jgi:hypothetical protein